MKKRLFALLLCLCMIATLLPMTALAEEPETFTLRTQYDVNRGNLYLATGDAAPVAGERYMGDNSEETIAAGETVSVLIVPQEDPDEVYVVARFNEPDGWFNGAVVEGGRAVKEGFAFENGVLTFTMPQDNIELNVNWSAEDHAFSIFNNTEDRPVLVEFNWWGNGDIQLSTPIPDEDMMRVDGRMKIRVPLDQESVTVVWSGTLEWMNVDGEEQALPEGGSYTLLLNKTWGGGEPKTFYSVSFDFAYDWGEHDGLLYVSYERNLGSVFFGLNETPAADAAHYVTGYWEDQPTYLIDGAIGTVKLLLDETKGFDWNAEYQTGEIAFREAEYAPDRVINIHAWFQRADGSYFDGYVVKNGAAVAEGFTFENGVLSFTPENDQRVELSIRWTQSDDDFEEFGPTEAFPILVQCNYRGAGTVKPEGVAPENMIRQDDRLKVRLPAGQKSVSFTWGEGDVLEEIQVQDNRAEDGWIYYESPEGTKFTLQLDQVDSGGAVSMYYFLDFQFESPPAAREAKLYLFNYNQSNGSVFLGMNEAPAADAAHYVDFDWDDAPRFVENGEIAAINILLDGTKTVDWQYWSDGTINLIDAPNIPDRALYVYAECRLSDGSWYDGPIIENGVLTKTGAGFTFRNNVLSFTPIDATNVQLMVYWTKADADFNEFRPTEEKPIIVTCHWHGDGEVQLPAGIPAEDMIVQSEEQRAKFRVPADTESVTFTWNESEQIRSVWYYDEMQDTGVTVETFDGASFTLPLNQTYQDGSPKTYYDVDFMFRYKPISDNSARVFYTYANGTAFWSIGAPAAAADETTLVYGGREAYFHAGDTIYLTLDQTRGLNAEELQDGNIVFTQLAPNPDYLPTILIEQADENDEWSTVTAVKDGVAQAGYSFQNNVFSFTPKNSDGMHIYVYWTAEETAFFTFNTTEDKPVMVELYASNNGVLTLPASIPAEDTVSLRQGNYRYYVVRLPLDTETLPVSWGENDKVTLVEIDGAGEDGGMLQIENPPGTSYTIQLNQTWENGQPANYYHAGFHFGEAAPHTHTTEIRGAKDATCTEDGYTGDEVCTVCGEVVKQGQVIPAKGHTWGDWEVTKPATAFEEGTETRTCSVCGAQEFRTIPKLTPSGWYKDAGKWYFFENGAAVTGWKKVSNVWYYFDNDGVMQTGWQKLGGVWYYFQPGGQMVTGWQKIGNVWYYFASGGAMQTGWQKIGNVWYYFAPGGAMQTGWQTIGGKTYYFKPSGAMAANEWCGGWWLNADGSWTYPYKGSWKQDAKGWWFGDTSGWYAKNTTVKINDVLYTFNAAGYLK